MDNYHYDCRFFNGYKPCKHNNNCLECTEYSPKNERILIIRSHQLGNIIKSTPILYALKKKYDNPWITWVCDSVAVPILDTNPLIDEIIEYNWEAALLLQAREFDLVINLEANFKEAALAKSISAKKYLGFSIHDSGSLCPFNEQSLSYTSLSFSDDLRFHKNNKTFAELCFNLVGVPYNGEEYILNLTKEDYLYANNILKTINIDTEKDIVVGIAMGGDRNRFPNKCWPTEYFLRLVRILHSEIGAKILLIGGPFESEVNPICYE